MEYKNIFINDIEDRIKTETNKHQKENLIKLLKIIKTESLYKAALYNYPLLKPSTKTHYEMYQIPDIYQAFIDAIINPSLLTNPLCFFDIVQNLTTAISAEELYNNQDIKKIIPNMTFDSANLFFRNPQSSLLLDKQDIYDTILQKAQEDKRFYSIIPYNKFSLEDGTALLIAIQDNGSKLIKEDSVTQLKVLTNHLPGTNIKLLLQQFSKLSSEVQNYIIKTPEFLEQLIIIISENKYQDNLIPEKYEEDIIIKKVDFIKELSYEQKLTLISQIHDAKIQKYLMTSTNFAKNLLSHNESYLIFKTIKDQEYLVEILCNLEMLKFLSKNKISYIIPELPVETQRKIFNHPIFQEYIRKHIIYSDVIRIVAYFDESIIDNFLPLLKKIGVFDYLELLRVTENKKYISKIIEELEKLKLSKNEEYTQILEYISKQLIDEKFVALMNDEEFNYFNEATNKIYDITKAEQNLNHFTIPSEITEKEKNILLNLGKNIPTTKEEINALKTYRLNCNFESKIKTSIDIIKSSPTRTIESIKYEILNRISPEEIKIILDKMTIEGLIAHIKTSKHFIDYVYELYKTKPELFNSIETSKTPKIIYSEENLDESSTKKLIELFFIVPKEIQEELLNDSFILNPIIKKHVEEIISTDPNYFNGAVYQKIEIILSSQKLKNILETLSLENIINYYSNSFLNFDNDITKNKVKDEILIKRMNEITHEINLNTNNILSLVTNGTIINMIYKVAPNKEEFLLSLEPSLLFDTFNQHPWNDETKKQNELIIKILSQKPSIFSKIKEDKIKRVLITLAKQELKQLLDNFTTSDLITLLSKTQNKDIEETLLEKFNNNPYFINHTSQSLEEILNRLEENNKRTIYSKIDYEFKNLELPHNIKDKLKKLSYDEKIFLIYGVHENSFDDEKYQMIIELLKKDPFALNSLSIELFKNDIFNISKNIIPKIYRYELLTINYINLLKSKTIRSKILLLLIEHLNKNTINETVYIQKLDTIINYLSKRNDLMIDRYNINNISEKELTELEEYILIDSREYLIETSNMHEFYKIIERENPGNHNNATSIEQQRIIDLDTKMDTEVDLDETLNIYFKKYFKIDKQQATLIFKKYITSLNIIKQYITDVKSLNIFNEISNLLRITSVDQVKELYYSNTNQYKIEDILYLFEDLNKAYNKSIADSLKGIKNGKEKAMALILNDETIIINAIELESDFDIFAHSTDAYGSMEMINDNYFDSWNYSDKTSNHGICTSYISNSNLGTAKVKGKGVMFGFTKLNEKSISSMAPYDLVSRNEAIITTSNRPPMYTDTNNLANYTRHTHNEVVLERRNITEESLYPVIQPDCIIIFEEMDENIKGNSIKAQKDFKENGIDLPIIYINKHKIIEMESNKLRNMINSHKKTPNLELLSEIINKYETNRCGLDFEENLDVEKIFHKKEIIEAIISTIRQLKELGNKDDIIKFINIIECEIYKFTIIQETVGERAHVFDLLNDQIQIEIEKLKRIYLTEETSTLISYFKK